MKQKKNSSKSEKYGRQLIRYRIAIIVFVLIIIILLFLHFYDFVTHTNIGKFTGDYDIYEITLKGTCECEKCHTCEDDVIEKPVVKPIDPAEEDDNYDPSGETGFIVYDQDSKWDHTSDTIKHQPNIFRHSSYEVINNKIAPGTRNIYTFIVRNINDFAVKYTIDLEEVNSKNINMKYRLRTANDYIFGSHDHWVDADTIVTSFINLAANASDTYYLDWKWFEDDNDTAIGIDDTSTYSLMIKIEAEE